MELIRGRFSRKYINCPEDKRDYDIMRRGYMQSHEFIASDYCEGFHVPDITDEEKKEISEYWAKFGIKIYDYSWHRMYYYATGIRDPRFVPDMVAGLVLYEYYNDKVFEHAWRDKNMFDRLLPDVPLPKAYGKCIRGRLITEETGYLSGGDSDYEIFASAIYNALVKDGENSIIIKNTRDTGFGKSVSKYTLNSEADAVAAISEWKKCKNFIVQECIRQHSSLAALNESSTNMMRVCSWRHGNEVDILFAAVRAGVPGSVTDVCFIDGVETVRLVGITKDGFFADKMLDQNGQFVKALPAGVPVPAWDKIVNIVKKNHLLIDNFDIVGWDFTVNHKGEPKCFEWNISWPGTVLYQYTNGPLYGDKTEEIFEFLQDENNRFNYIPYYMRLRNK